MNLTPKVTDFHSHILPAIDDGSRSVEMSIEMLRMEAQQGITHVIATPHFYPRHEDPIHFLAKRATAEALLREEMARHPGLPELTVGAEVAFFPGMSQSEHLKRLTIFGKRYILIEMPGAPWPEECYRELQEICDQGLTPIIAHVDRYIAPFRTHGIPRRLAELPVMIQANASFFLDRSTAGMAMRMLKADQIHVLGSDCHNLADRQPNLGAALSAIEQKLGRTALYRIRRNEMKILRP